MSATPLPVLVTLIISAYILSAAFGRSGAEEAPKSVNERPSAAAVRSGGGSGPLKQQIGEQMKSELQV